MKNTFRLSWIRSLILLFGVLSSLCFLNSCQEDYDLDEKLPPGFGTSIYSYLASRSEFSTYVKLIDDLDYSEVLSKTGSKTLFVADNEAFQRFYSRNDWGVREYKDLTMAQKQLIVKSAMLDNSLQIANLSSSIGPTKGDCMRRQTSASIYDSVPVISVDEMSGNNECWSFYKESGKNIVCFKDASSSPMLHFIEKFLEINKITNDDIDFLYNYRVKREVGDAMINGLIVTERNIKCANGFIHVLEDVMLPLDNIAEVVRKNQNTSIFSSMLERFSAPYYDEDRSITNEYNRIYGTSIDTVFQKRYFSERSMGNTSLRITPGRGPVEATLKFDPGWNQYFASTVTSVSNDKALQKNMGVMLVPTDQAIMKWWTQESGVVLKDYYKEFDSIPLNVISKLLNNNMLNSFINSVPSKFETILNDANNPIGISTNDVDSVLLACNGAVYMTNKVFNPTAYVSVTFPALVNQTMNIIYWAVEDLEYYAYLNSMDSYYSFFIPTNNGMLDYVDPVSYGTNQRRVFRFRYDPTAIEANRRVRAGIYRYDEESKTIIDSIGDANYYQIRNRLLDVLQNHIVIGDVEDGYKYYRTKNGGIIKVDNAHAGANGMTVQGTYQIDRNETLPVSVVYDQSPETNGGEGNGKSYIIEQGPLLTTHKTISEVLSEHDEFSEFYAMLRGSGLLETIHNKNYACGGENISVLNTYHYTVYAPTNSSIKQLVNSRKLPTWEDVEMAEQVDEEGVADSLSNVIINFVKYHIQDNSIYIGQDTTGINGYFETASINPETDKFYRVNVQFTSDAKNLDIIDHAGNKRHIVTTNENLYNLSAREYQYNNSNAANASEIFTSSFAVIHQIDGPLLY